MKLLIASFGTRGDIAPFATLARAARHRGHHVTFCGPPDQVALVESSGATFVPTGDPYADVLREMDAGPRRVVAALGRQVRAQFAVLAPLVQAADVVLTGSIEYATPTLCEAANKPRRSVLFSPAMVPGSRLPMPFIPAFGMPRWFNRLTWWLSDLAAGVTVMKLVDAERHRRGLAKAGSASRHIVGEEVWVPFPAALFPMKVGDFTPFRQFDPWQDSPGPLPSVLADFLSQGPAPVYVGTGSMPPPKGAPEVYIQAASRSGHRMVIQGPFLPDSPEADVCWVSGPVSHASLFPRCACIVHHGGAGTTVAATAAGRPQVVVPFIADQHFHARLVETGHLGVRVARRGFGPDTLAAAITAALATAADTRQSAATGSTQGALDSAVDALEALRQRGIVATA